MTETALQEIPGTRWRSAISAAHLDEDPAEALKRAWVMPDGLPEATYEAEETVLWLSDSAEHRLLSWLRRLVKERDHDTLAELAELTSQRRSLPRIFQHVRDERAAMTVEQLLACAVAVASDEGAEEALSAPDKVVLPNGGLLDDLAVRRAVIEWLLETEREPEDSRSVGVLSIHRNEGRPCRLVLERVQPGGGQLVPDPRMLLVDRSKIFQQTEEEAREHVMSLGIWPDDVDVRWRLEELEAEGLAGVPQLKGASAGAAFAAGLRCLLEGLPIGPRYAVTAAIAPDGKLAAVAGFSEKCIAAEMSTLSYVVAESKQAATLRICGQIEAVGAETVGDVVRFLGQDAGMIEQYLSALETECDRPLLRHVTPGVTKVFVDPSVTIQGPDGGTYRWSEAENHLRDIASRRLSQFGEDTERAERRWASVILGPSGAGKTTLLRYDALNAAKRAREQLLESPGAMILPIVVSAGDLASDTPIDGVVADNVVERLTDPKLKQEMSRFAADIFNEGRCWLYVDGLDETDEADRGKIVKAIADAIEAGCGVMLTSRPGAWHRFGERHLPEMVECRLEPLEQDAISKLVAAWFSWKGASHSDVQRFARGLQSRPQLSGLATTPLMVVLLCWAFHRNNCAMPHGLGEVMHELISVAMDEATRSRRYLYSPDRRDAAYQRLAWHLLQNHSQGLKEIDAENCLVNEGVVNASEARYLLADLVDGDGLLVCHAGRLTRYEFLFPALVDYFAAEHMASQHTTKETVAMAQGLLPDKQKHSAVALLGYHAHDPLPLLDAIVEFEDQNDTGTPMASDFTDLLAGCLLESESDHLVGDLGPVWDSMTKGLELSQRTYRDLQWQELRWPGIYRRTLTATREHGSAADAAAASELLNAISDDDGSLEQETIEAVLSYHHTESLPCSLIRWAVMRSVAIGNGPAAQAHLTEAAEQDPCPSVSAVAIRGLGEVAQLNALDRLKALLDDSRPVAVQNALIALGRLGREFPQAVVDELVERAKSAVLSGPSEVVSGAVGALEDMTHSRILFRPDNSDIRSRIARTLHTTLKVLMDQQDVIWDACASAASGLGKLRWGPATDDLVRVLDLPAREENRTAPRDKLRRSACWALGQFKNREFAELFARLVRCPDEPLLVRQTAAGGLVGIVRGGHDLRVLERDGLVAALCDADLVEEEKLFENCAKALFEDGPDSIAHLLRSIADIPTDHVRQLIEFAEANRERHRRAANTLLIGLSRHPEAIVVRLVFGRLHQMARARAEKTAKAKDVNYAHEELPPPMSSEPAFLNAVSGACIEALCGRKERRVLSAALSTLTQAFRQQRLKHMVDMLDKPTKADEAREGDQLKAVIERAFGCRQDLVSEATPVVARMTRSPEPTVRASACGALAELAGAKAPRMLDDLRQNDPSPMVRRTARNALWKTLCSLQSVVYLEHRTGCRSITSSPDSLRPLAITVGRLSQSDDGTTAKNAWNLFRTMKGALKHFRLI